jgi:UPF0042 nucleotide-binding protein
MTATAQVLASPRQPVVLVTGLSGAGKSSILRTLEDLGYEAIDNPPLELVEELVAGGGAGPGRKIAVGVDVRSRGFDAAAVLETLARLRRNPTLRPQLVVAWADDGVLQRRYTETRRRHPLSPHGRVADGIAAERALTAKLREAADLVIDTSELPLASLRRVIDRHYGPEAQSETQASLAVTLISFAFPAGLPREADMVFDARFLRNPHYVDLLRCLTGKEPAVGAYIEGDPDYQAFYAAIVRLLELVLPRFVQEGKKYATIAVGCTGGRHRSVHIVERLASHFTQAGWRVSTTHRELVRDEASAHAERGESRPPAQAQEA